MSGILNSIKEILKQNPDITLISFDLFDTILFRMVKEPVDVFNKVAEKALKTGCLSSHITPEMYKNIRIESEKKARQIKYKKSHTTEVTLEEIIDCLPKVICSEKNKLTAIELATEQELCYLNPDIRETLLFLQDWKTNEKKIIITSDMYLSSEQEKSLLKANGLTNTDIFDQIIVSSECLCTKTQGTLYSYLLEKFQIKPKQLLHIGDNYISDIVNAQYLDLNTIHYDILTQHYNELQLEELKYGQLVPELLSLRKFSHSQSKSLNANTFWFQIGFMFMGPLMTGMSEWVLNTAEQTEIENIYPLMREGMIFSKLLKQAMKYRKKYWKIVPLYISRKSTFLPSMVNFSENEFEQLISIKHGTLKTAFEMLELPWKNSCFEPYISIPLSDIRKENLYDKLKEYFLSENIRLKINQTIQKKTKEIMQYFSESGLTSSSFITVDIGVRGSIPYAIEKILRKQNNIQNNNIHLMTFGSNDCIEKIMDNIDIRGYVGSCGENDDINFMFVQKAHIFEQFLMCEDGTTTGYIQNETGKTIPILKNSSNLTGNQLNYIKTIQQGMLKFQEMYLKLKQDKPQISIIEGRARELAQIAMRVILLPTSEEAWNIGELSIDENFGVDKIIKICPETSQNESSFSTPQQYIQKHPPGSIKWLEGSVTRKFPTYYLEKLLENNLSQYEHLLLQIVKKAADKNVKKVVIVGAGEAGKKIYHYLVMYGIQVEAFADNNPKLYGKQIYGIPVKVLIDNFESNNYIVASFAFAEELKKQIRKEKGSNAKIFYYSK